MPLEHRDRLPLGIVRYQDREPAAVAGADVPAARRPRGVAPIIAAPLVLVGTMMIGGLRHVAWDDPTGSVPAFLTLVIMPLAVSISEGVAFGLVAYAVLKLASGRRRETHPLVYVFAGLFLLRYAFLR